MAVHEFKVISGISSGGNDATLYYDQLEGETYDDVRDSLVANNVNLIATEGAVGQMYSNFYTEHHRISRPFFLFKQSLDLNEYTFLSVNLKFRALLLEVGDGDFDVIIQKANSTDIHHQPPVAGDYNRANIVATSGGSANTSEMEFAEPSTVWISIPFNSTGISWIGRNINDILKVVLRSSDDINGISTVLYNYVTFYTGNNATASLRPYISIKITVDTPTVTILPCTNVALPNATLNGRIDDKGHWIGSYGFQTKRGLTGTITTTTVGTDTDQTITTFSYNKTGLSVLTTNYVRAWCTNESGTGYGEWIAILPTSVTTEAVDQIAYKCAMGNGTITSETNATERGFEVKLSYVGTLGNYVFHHIAGFLGDVTYTFPNWIGTLIKTESESGDFVQGAFELVLGYPSVLGNPSYIFSDSLFECESYTYRARATIDGVVYYGEWVAFDTLCHNGQGVHEDDQLPIEDIIPPLPPIEPIEFPPFEFPPFEWPEFKWPEFEYPDIPSYNGSWLGAFYYRKAFGKKDLDELRKKCRIFLDNSVEYALVLNHNMQVLKQFLNDMHNYMTDIDEYNTFKPIIPTQWVNELAHKPLDIKDFKVIINNFISNSIDNASNVNHNFRLIRDGINSVMSGEDIGMEINSIELRTKTVEDDSPDVERLKKVIDALSSELEGNYEMINHNLHVIRATLI